MTDTPPQFEEHLSMSVAEDVLPMVEELSLGEQERLLHLLISHLTGLGLCQVERMSRQQLKAIADELARQAESQNPSRLDFGN